MAIEIRQEDQSQAFLPSDGRVATQFDLAQGEYSPTLITAEQRRKLWPQESKRILSLMQNKYPSGFFTVGIESSDPVVKLLDKPEPLKRDIDINTRTNADTDGLVRRNQLAEAEDFYANYEWRLENCKAVNAHAVRFGEGYSQVHLGHGIYNWHLTDQVMEKTQKLGLEVIADLIHFGLPDWMHAQDPDHPFFQNSSFPEYVAAYATEFAIRYPQVTSFTLINEPYVTAKKSAIRQHWNERRGDEQSFARASINIAKAALLAKEAIESVWVKEGRDMDQLLFFQNESLELGLTHPDFPNPREVELFNIRKFIPLDLIFGNRNERVREFLLENGISQEEYEDVINKGNRDRMILGLDHYPSSVQKIISLTEAQYCTPDDPYVMPAVAKEYIERYEYMPAFHMEVNWEGEYGHTLLDLTYIALRELQAEGYPIIPGLTYYGDNKFNGWQHHLMRYEPHAPGLYNGRDLLPIGGLFADYAQQGFPDVK